MKEVTAGKIKSCGFLLEFSYGARKQTAGESLSLRIMVKINDN